jgi:hypothetical protein
VDENALNVPLMALDEGPDLPGLVERKEFAADHRLGAFVRIEEREPEDAPAMVVGSEHRNVLSRARD